MCNFEASTSNHMMSFRNVRFFFVKFQFVESLIRPLKNIFPVALLLHSKIKGAHVDCSREQLPSTIQNTRLIKALKNKHESSRSCRASLNKIATRSR